MLKVSPGFSAYHWRECRVERTQPPSSSPGRVVIVTIYYDGQVQQVESDEYCEIQNEGGPAVKLGGWRLNADDEGQSFWFPKHMLGPGASYRVNTNEVHPESCRFSLGSGQVLWNISIRSDGTFMMPVRSKRTAPATESWQRSQGRTLRGA